MEMYMDEEGEAKTERLCKIAEDLRPFLGFGVTLRQELESGWGDTEGTLVEITEPEPGRRGTFEVRHSGGRYGYCLEYVYRVSKDGEIELVAGTRPLF